MFSPYWMSGKEGTIQNACASFCISAFVRNKRQQKEG